MIQGIHHITAITSDAQKNLDFYAGILGLRLVKKTVNFDAPDVYHLYYGNEKGDPGTVLTFFPFPGIPKGKKGKGQVVATAFSIPPDSVEYWKKRLERFAIPFQEEARFGETVLIFEDGDGLGLELIAVSDSRKPYAEGPVSKEFAIRGFHGATLAEECNEKTAALLSEQMDHALVAEEGNRFRYSSGGHFIDLLCSPDALQGTGGYGTIHHIAFASSEQKKARARLAAAGMNVTPILDRQYFHSVYFREPGGVLFEIATPLPGFLIDESIAHLGESLKLPPWYERDRPLIEKALKPIQLDLKRFM